MKIDWPWLKRRIRYQVLSDESEGKRAEKGKGRKELKVNFRKVSPKRQRREKAIFFFILCRERPGELIECVHDRDRRPRSARCSEKKREKKKKLTRRKSTEIGRRDARERKAPKEKRERIREAYITKSWRPGL